MKGGQVSYFILVAVLLVIVMAALLYVFSNQNKIQVVTQGSPIPAMPAIENFVKSCVEIVATKGVYHIAYHGGYINPRGDPKYQENGDGKVTHHFTKDTSLPYVADGSTLMLRSLSQVTDALSHYVLVNLGECLDFTNFERQGLTVKKPNIDFEKTGFLLQNTRVDYAEESVTATTKIREESVSLVVNYPIVIESRRGTAAVSKVSAEIPLRLGKLHSITGKVIADASSYNPYDLRAHCPKFGAKDAKINLYLDSNPHYQEHALLVVDAQPLDRGFLPLKFQVGVKNQNLTGVCRR